MSEVGKATPLKIVLLGDVKVGKSSLIDKYQQQNPTVSLITANNWLTLVNDVNCSKMSCSCDRSQIMTIARVIDLL